MAQHFISFRRHYLDVCYNNVKSSLNGRVIDIGGHKKRRRGTFTPPENALWHTVNIDEATEPDFLASAEALPVNDGDYDAFILSEVLEHVAAPDTVLREAHRVLKADGKGYIAMPFLNAVHAHPDDYRRWTAYEMRQRVEKAGFIVERLEPMGGWLAVSLDLLLYHFHREEVRCKRLSFFARALIKFLLCFSQSLIALDKKLFHATMMDMTTGWFVVVSKAV